MGRAEHIPGLDPKDPKRALFSTDQFDLLRRELGQVTTIGEQHSVLEQLFLATKLVTIGDAKFDTMPRPSKAYNCDFVPAISDAGIEHLFTWFQTGRRETIGAGHPKPRLSLVVAPRMIPSNPGLTAKLKPETRIVYGFQDSELTSVRTADRYRPVRFSYAPDQPVEDTLFASLGEYICRRIEAQLVVVAGRGFFDKPEELPAPIPYSTPELQAVR